MKRREYDVRLVVNGISIKKVIIDPHYEKKHAKSINDKLILNLVKTLDTQFVEPELVDPPYLYFKMDKIALADKLYKMIWLLEEHQMYIGVVNVYRRR